jgi:hypothetical protein
MKSEAARQEEPCLGRERGEHQGRAACQRGEPASQWLWWLAIKAPIGNSWIQRWARRCRNCWYPSSSVYLSYLKLLWLQYATIKSIKHPATMASTSGLFSIGAIPIGAVLITSSGWRSVARSPCVISAGRWHKFFPVDCPSVRFTNGNISNQIVNHIIKCYQKFLSKSTKSY